MNKAYSIFVVFLLLGFANVHGQGLICDESEPFCTGSIYTFPAGTTGQAEYGPFYGCLQTQPCPAWYHMLIDDPGSITIYMYSTPQEDIDFICWGPFTDPFDPCVEGLTSNKVVDCSYSPAPTEYCDIPNGQTGQYYILLITNFSTNPCEITFSQTGGNGSTDCTILPPPVGNNGPLCVGETLYLTAETVANASYYWSGPAGFLSTQQNPVIPNVTMANAGDYSCVITVNGQSSDPAITSVVIHSLPTAQLLSPDTTVCPGSPAYAIMNFTGWGPFEVTYNDGSNTFVADNLYGPQDTVFLYPIAPTTYTFTKVADLHCERNILFMQLVAGTYPSVSGTLSGSTTICAGMPVDLTFNLTGTPPWTITYTENGGNPQEVAANTSPYIHTVYPSVPTTYAFVYLEDINCSGETSGEAVVNVDPAPTANAGTDKTIPYGTSTSLSGQVSGGSGNYSYHWEPAAKLTNPDVQSPATVNLTESTIFTLTGTDNNGDCYDLDDMTVTITGGALNCLPAANPPVLCAGESAQLFAAVSGGSGDYTYLWSSNPSGFSSYIANPVVSPTQTTTYNVTVNDGYNVTSGNVTVTVRPLPVPEAGNDITIPHGTVAYLQGSASGGSGNYAYHWEPAAKLVDPDVANPQTVNLYATTLFNLFVTDLTHGCEADVPDQMSVVVSGDILAVNPTVSVDEVCLGGSVQLFALAGGGSGTYSYSWTSSTGFSSTDQDPWITPNIPGMAFYTCEVNDGFNTAEGTVAVNVRAVPFINLGFADTTVCVYDTIWLDAGNPGSSYIWSNGSADRITQIATSGIGFDMQTYSVTVTNQAGCQSTSSATVVFDFSACTGIDAARENSPIGIYPNPGDGTMVVHFIHAVESAEVFTCNILGQKLNSSGLIRNVQENKEIKLDLGDLPDGIYFIHIITNKSSIFTTKYILRR